MNLPPPGRFSVFLAASLLAVPAARAGFPDLRLVPVTSGRMIAPVELAHAGDGSGRLFIADQLGTIRILDTASDTLRTAPFLDLAAKLVPLSGGYDERGLLGLAFHPGYASNGKFYVSYSAPSPNWPGTASAPVNHRSVVAEYAVSAQDPNLADPGSERILLTIDQPQSNHNGGDLCFGPDGMLYLSFGDGGSSNDNNAGHTGGSSSRPADALGNAQDRTNLLGKILRIDPSGSNGPGGQYGIPVDNPFVGEGGGIRGEIFAYGLRNPWRMSFDTATGRLFAGDVGQGNVEEVDLIVSGGNYGWRKREGGLSFAPGTPASGPFVEPIAQYAHPPTAVGEPPLPVIGLSVTGGEVYRGSAIAGLAGRYLFADWSTDFGRPEGTMLGLEETVPGTFTLSVLKIAGGNPMPFFITALGRDEEGEIYVAARTVGGPRTDFFGRPSGTVFRITADGLAAATPRLLGLSEASDTGASATDGLTADNTPTVLGYAPIGSRVRLFANGVEIANRVVDSLPFAITPAASLPDGSRDLTATGTEGTRTSPASAPLPITIDTVGPRAGVLDLLEASDSGISATDNVTNDATPALRSSLGGGEVFEFRSDVAGVIGSGPGNSTVTMQPLPDGVHRITAVPSGPDPAGNAGEPSAVLTVTIDTSAPDPPGNLDLAPASDTGVSDADNLTSDRTLEVSGSGAEGTTVTLVSDLAGAVGGTAGAAVWSLGTVPLAVGTHALTARASDPAGNGSAPSPSLTVRITDPRQGREVVVPAAAAPLPVAVPVPLPTTSGAAAGIYDGLLRKAAEDGEVIGAASRLVLSATGVLSGTVRLNGQALAVRAPVSAEGRIEAQVPVPRNPPVSLDLQLGRTEAGGWVFRGTISWNGIQTEADLPGAPFHATRHPLAEALRGNYALLIPSSADWEPDEPGGDGWARVGLSSAGAVSIKGVLGDGTPFTEAAFVSADREIHCFTDLHRLTPEKKRGRIGGRLVLADQPESDLAGRFFWVKFADPREARFREGFSLRPWGIGSRYTPPPAGRRVLAALADQEANAEFSFLGPAAPGTDDDLLVRAVSWKTTNRLVHYGPQSLSGTVSATDGGLSGSFFDPVTRERVSFTGMTFLKQNLVAGNFVHGPGTGAVRIRPDAGVDYPGREPAGDWVRTRVPSSPARPPDRPDTEFAPAAAGLYNGVLTRDGVVTGGLVNFSLQASRTFSASLWIGTARFSLRGTLNPDGGLLLELPRPLPLAPVALRLQLGKGGSPGDAFGLGGEVTIDGLTHRIDAQRWPVFPRTAPAPEAGAYTLVMHQPEGSDAAIEPGGDGYGVLTVRPDGGCLGTFNLSDGTPFTLAGAVARRYDDGGTPVAEWSFHRALYGRTPKGCVAGKLTFRAVPSLSDVDGEWRWVKSSGAAPAGAYPVIDTSRRLIGSRYQVPASGVRAFGGLADREFNVWLRFSGPDLSGKPEVTILARDLAATWDRRNQIRYYGPEQLPLSLNPRTGLVTGRFTDPASGISASFGGVVLQTQDGVAGSYRAQGWSGWFRIQPR
jgi:glucose/arabinose dehydrogenase